MLVQLPPADYYKHETHHFYHAGPPRVYQVRVPVTQRPVTVHVPQNVPVNFVPVHVPTQSQGLGPLSVVELDPFGRMNLIYFWMIKIYFLADQYGFDGFDGFDSSTGLFGRWGDQYVRRKELVKGGLLLGAGMVKGAVLTTIINGLNDSKKKPKT